MIECIGQVGQVCVGFINTHLHYLPSTLNKSAVDHFFRPIFLILANLSFTHDYGRSKMIQKESSYLFKVRAKPIRGENKRKSVCHENICPTSITATTITSKSKERPTAIFTSLTTFIITHRVKTFLIVEYFYFTIIPVVNMPLSS